MYSFSYSIKLFLEHVQNKQKPYNKTIHRLLMQDARIIIPKFKGTNSESNLYADNREKGGIFSIITDYQD